MSLNGRELVELKPQGEKLEAMCTVINIYTIATTIEKDCYQSVRAHLRN